MILLDNLTNLTQEHLIADYELAYKEPKHQHDHDDLHEEQPLRQSDLEDLHEENVEESGPDLKITPFDALIGCDGEHEVHDQDP